MEDIFIYVVNSTISFIDYPDNKQWSTIVYFSGCSHKCLDCHNFNLQTYGIGKKYNIIDFYTFLNNECNKNKTRNVVFSGGDPLYIKNIGFIKEFLSKYSNEFNICIYTGFDIEYVKKNNIKGFKFIKCGTFDKNNKQTSGNFETYFQLASPNQNFYDDSYNQLSENGKLIYTE